MTDMGRWPGMVPMPHLRPKCVCWMGPVSMPHLRPKRLPFLVDEAGAIVSLYEDECEVGV